MDPCGGIGDQRSIFSTILPGTGIDPDSGSTVFGKTVSRLAELINNDNKRAIRGKLMALLRGV